MVITKEQTALFRKLATERKTKVIEDINWYSKKLESLRDELKVLNEIKAPSEEKVQKN